MLFPYAMVSFKSTLPFEQVITRIEESLFPGVVMPAPSSNYTDGSISSWIELLGCKLLIDQEVDPPNRFLLTLRATRTPKLSRAELRELIKHRKDPSYSGEKDTDISDFIAYQLSLIPGIDVIVPLP